MTKPRITNYHSHLLFSNPELLRLEYEQMSVCEIAKKYNTSRQNIAYHMKRLGLPQRSKKESAAKAKERNVLWWKNKEKRDDIRLQLSESNREYWATDEGLALRKVYAERNKNNRLPPPTVYQRYGPYRYYVAKMLRDAGYAVEVTVPLLNKKHQDIFYSLFLPEMNVVIDLFGTHFWINYRKYPRLFRTELKKRRQVIRYGYTYISYAWPRTVRREILFLRIRKEILSLLNTISKKPLPNDNRYFPLVFHEGLYERKILEEEFGA